MLVIVGNCNSIQSQMSAVR